MLHQCLCSGLRCQCSNTDSRASYMECLCSGLRCQCSKRDSRASYMDVAPMFLFYMHEHMHVAESISWPRRSLVRSPTLLCNISRICPFTALLANNMHINNITACFKNYTMSWLMMWWKMSSLILLVAAWSEWSELSCLYYDGFFYYRGAFGDPHDKNNYFHLEPLDLENGSVSCPLKLTHPQEFKWVGHKIN